MPLDSVTVTEKRPHDLRATVGTDGGAFGASLLNPYWQLTLNRYTHALGHNGYDYAAFVNAEPQLINGKIIFVFSDGPSHGDSDRKVMAKINDPTSSYTVDDIEVIDFRAAGSSAFNTSLLDDEMEDGDIFLFGNFLCTQTAGVISVVVLPKITEAGDEYAQWSRPVLMSDTNWYRTGYAADPGGALGSKCALFKSTDDRLTWTFVAVIATDPALRFTEAAIIEQTTPGELLAIVREDSTDGRPLYPALSTDFGLTWVVGTVYDETATNEPNGAQPDILRMDDDSIILMTGDRFGSSGMNNAGQAVEMRDSTGIRAWRSTDDGATWSHGRELAAFIGTDGGQPQMVRISTNRVWVGWYGVRDFGGKPDISDFIVNTAVL